MCAAPRATARSCRPSPRELPPARSSLSAPRRRARAPARLAPSRFPARETPSPSASRRFLAPRSSLSTPDTAGLPRPPTAGPCCPIPLASRALQRGPSPGALSPSLPSNSPSGRCHHVEASAATTALPAPAAAPHATGRGPPAPRGHQPSQRRPPGAAGHLRGSSRASSGRLPLPRACGNYRERAPPGSRRHLGAAAAAAAAAAAPGEARGRRHRQRQVRRVGSGRGTCGHLEAAARFRRGRPQPGTVRGTGWVGSPREAGGGPPQVRTGRRERIPRRPPEHRGAALGSRGLVRARSPGLQGRRGASRRRRRIGELGGARS